MARQPPRFDSYLRPYFYLEFGNPLRGGALCFWFCFNGVRTFRWMFLFLGVFARVLAGDSPDCMFSFSGPCHGQMLRGWAGGGLGDFEVRFQGGRGLFDVLA